MGILDYGESISTHEDYQPSEVLIIRPVTMAAISAFIPEARRSGLIFSPSTELYGLWLDTKLIGMAGLVRYATHWKLKNGFILPTFRRHGYYSRLLDYHLKMARNHGIPYVEATCTAMSLPQWLRRGALIIHRFKAVTKVRLML